MIDQEQKLTEIREKILLLKQLYRQSVTENQNLAEENGRLRELIDSQKITIKQLEDKNKITKIADAISLSKEDKFELKLKINEFVREIDKCIAMLSERVA
jgi:regulator of replication initiation timing